MALQKKPMIDEINITPLTDIFLVLLIIMMVVAPMLEYPGLKLAVPSVGPDEQTKEEPKTIAVVVDEQDQFFIEENRIGAPDLVRVLKEKKAQIGDKFGGVVIQVNPESSHQGMTAVMDAVQLAGIDKLAVTEFAGAAAPVSTEEP